MTTPKEKAALARRALRRVWAHLLLLNRMGFQKEDYAGGYIEDHQSFGIVVKQPPLSFKMLVEPNVALTEEEEDAAMRSFFAEEIRELDRESEDALMRDADLHRTGHVIAMAIAESGIQIPDEKLRRIVERLLKERRANTN